MRKIPPFILINLFYSNFQAIVCDVLEDVNCNFSQPSFLHVTEYNKNQNVLQGTKGKNYSVIYTHIGNLGSNVNCIS